MTLVNDFIKIVQKIDKAVSLPKIEEIYFPSVPEQKIPNEKNANNFGAIQLEDNSIGIVFLNLSEKVKTKAGNYNRDLLVGKNPAEIAKKFSEKSLLSKTLALGAINAISQYLFKESTFPFDFTTNSLGLLDLNPNDKVGMVGFFPPLVKKIEKLGIPLVIIEKKEGFLKETEKWEVSLDPKRLQECNKILSTTTTVLNDSVDDILRYSSKASKISFIGPTGGFLPDPLFKRNVNVIGGTYVENATLFMELIRKNKKWGPSTKKYCIKREDYSTYKKLLERIK